MNSASLIELQNANDVLDAWESITKRELSKPARRIGEACLIIYFREKRGIIRTDVENLGYSYHYARKILNECQNNKFLIPVDGHKQGRFKEYFLSTETHMFLEEQSKNSTATQKIEDNEISVIQILVNEITNRKPTFHKFVIHIKIKENKYTDFEQTCYNDLTNIGWVLQSTSNKAKVKSFKLGYKRSCTIQVYPNGKIIVAVGCTYRPFRLHETDDCREFFETVGKVSHILDQEFQGSSILPTTGEWLLKQYDRDVTIPESELLENYPYINHWYSKEGIKIKALGHVFQIYGKIMPICGKCMRLEDQVSIKEDVTLENGINNAKELSFKLPTAFELHVRNKERLKANKGQSS